MKLKPNDLPAHIKAINPQLFSLGKMETSKPKQTAPRALDSGVEKHQASQNRVVISIIQLRRRVLDTHDNARSACKPLVDAISATLHIDDADPRVRWQYGQVQTTGELGVIVKVELNDAND